MEEVIRFRLAVNQLDNKEFNVFVDRFGKDEMISLMLKGIIFMHQYSQNKYDQITNVNNIISNIIESREIKNKPNENIINNESFKINKLPNVLIRECASYLNIYDYLHFSQCDGSIYVSCNSPSSLQYLDMIKDGYPNNLNKFPLLKTISFKPSEFNKKYNNSSIVLNHIKCLSLDMRYSNDHSEIVKFMNMKCIDFSAITTLQLRCFGKRRRRYDCGLFCKFVKNFPNVNCLDINYIYFDQFTNENNIISQILPQLKTFKFVSTDVNANLFKDKLIETHSKQIISLHYDGETDTNILKSDSFKSLKLTELMVDSPNIDTLSQLIKQSTQLKRVYMNLYGIRSTNENNKKIENIITSLYTKYSKINEIQVSMNINQFDKIIEWTEIGLSDSQYTQYDYLKIMYEIDYQGAAISMRNIFLHLTRMINALNVCSTKHFMIIFRIYENMNAIEVNKKAELIEKLKKKYLVFEEQTYSYRDCTWQKIIVSNKRCAINGYQFIW